MILKRNFSQIKSSSISFKDIKSPDSNSHRVMYEGHTLDLHFLMLDSNDKIFAMYWIDDFFEFIIILEI